jgi:hypothetical protein
LKNEPRVNFQPGSKYFVTPVKGCKFLPMLRAQGLRAGKYLNRAIPAVTRHLGFSGLIRMTDPFRLIQADGVIYLEIRKSVFFVKKKNK